MAEQLRGLSASDVSKIKRLMSSHNNRPVNTTTLPIVPEGDWHENQQTEAYIVKTPEGGIPAMVDGGSGDYRPGSAVCPVYRIGYDLTNNIGEYVLYQSTATDRLVFNVSLTAIEGNTFLLVDRDKHGNWVTHIHGAEPVDTGTGETACPITPSVRRELIGVYQVKSGANVTDVYQRFQDVTTDANGCVTRGTPYCVIAPSDCGTTRNPAYYCINDVCWEYYDGLVPSVYDAGPFESASACSAGCPAASGIPSCCPSMSSPMGFATLSGGHGTKAMPWNGTSWRSASFTLPCVSGDFLLNFSQGCELTWSNDGGETWYGFIPAGTTSCGPPLSSTGWGFSPGGSCGTITVSVTLS